jgi:predicted DNA-binding ArsR family transcriptional regulator
MDALTLSDQELKNEIDELRSLVHDQEKMIERGEESLNRSELRAKMTRLNRLSIEARRRGLVEE